MTIGDWIYYHRKYKLAVVKNFGFKRNKKILALTYEHDWKVPSGYTVKYYDLKSPFTIIGTPSLVIEREFNDGKSEYEFLYKHTLKKVPKAFWFIDAHVSDIKRVSYCDNFDFVFVAHSPYIDYVKKHTKCKNIFWLPVCFPKPSTDIYKEPVAVKYELSFIGSFNQVPQDDKIINKRYEMIEFLKKEYSRRFFVTTDFANMPMLLKQSKITANHSIKNDLNFRVFESLGYGTEIITNNVTDLDKIDGLKERLYCYNNFHELKIHIDDLLANKPGKMHYINESQEWINRHHTINQRITAMLQMIDTGKQFEFK